MSCSSKLNEFKMEIAQLISVGIAEKIGSDKAKELLTGLDEIFSMVKEGNVYMIAKVKGKVSLCIMEEDKIGFDEEPKFIDLESLKDEIKNSL